MNLRADEVKTNVEKAHFFHVSGTTQVWQGDPSNRSKLTKCEGDRGYANDDLLGYTPSQVLEVPELFLVFKCLKFFYLAV